MSAVWVLFHRETEGESAVVLIVAELSTLTVAGAAPRASACSFISSDIMVNVGKDVLEPLALGEIQVIYLVRH